MCLLDSIQLMWQALGWALGCTVNKKTEASPQMSCLWRTYFRKGEV